LGIRELKRLFCTNFAIRLIRKDIGKGKLFGKVLAVRKNAVTLLTNLKERFFSSLRPISNTFYLRKITIISLLFRISNKSIKPIYNSLIFNIAFFGFGAVTQKREIFAIFVA